MSQQPVNPQSPPQPIVPIPTYVYNHDVVGLLNRIGRFITELVRSDSSNLNSVSAADQARWGSYLNNIDSYQLHVVSAPALDLPKTSHSIQWPIEPLDTIPAMNNESIEDAVRLFTVEHAELANSESGGCSSGLTVFDAARLTAITNKCRKLLSDYVAVSTPIDLPASSPMDAITPIAKPGV